MKNKLLLLSLLIASYSLQLGAQEVYENHRSEVYNYTLPTYGFHIPLVHQAVNYSW